MDCNIKTNGNSIYFYDYISQESAIALIEELSNLQKSVTFDRLINKTNAKIWLHINSNGGSLHDSFAIADTIEYLQIPVYSVVEGLCASGATVIALACKRRYIMPNAFMLLHQFSNANCGTFEQLEDDHKGDKLVMKMLVDFYVDHTPLDKKSVKNILRHNTWLNSAMAVKLGIVDGVYGV